MPKGQKEREKKWMRVLYYTIVISRKWKAIRPNRATPTKQKQEFPIAVNVLISITLSLWVAKLALKVL
jgi:hypothetical protein